MNFDEIVVKESPGICRCCLSEGCYKDLGTEYIWMNDTEVYADMLLDCFDISITQRNDGPNGAMRLICEVCITRLRDACNFKKQVVDSEQRFIDMLGRGEFRSKVSSYQPPRRMKEEVVEETPEDVMSQDVEYLDDVDYDGGENERSEEVVKIEFVQSTSKASTSEEPRPKRGRPKKDDEKPEKPKRQKLQKMAKDLNFKRIVLPIEQSRRNLEILFNNTTIVPFKHRGQCLCFYCGLKMKDRQQLIEHNQTHLPCSTKHNSLKILYGTDFEIKVDVSDVRCKICFEQFSNVYNLGFHLAHKHKLPYELGTAVGFVPFRLIDLKCIICFKQLKSLRGLIQHTNKEHPVNYFECEDCGRKFRRKHDLMGHINQTHKEVFRCPKCPETFKSKAEYGKHKNEGHISQCNVCFKIFSSSILRLNHMKVEHDITLGGTCGFCHKKMNSRFAFLDHAGKCTVGGPLNIEVSLLPVKTDMTDTNMTDPMSWNPSVKTDTNMSDPISWNPSVKTDTNMTDPMSWNPSVKTDTNMTDPMSWNSSVKTDTNMTDPMSWNPSVKSVTNMTDPMSWNPYVKTDTDTTTPVSWSTPVNTDTTGPVSWSTPVKTDSTGPWSTPVKTDTDATGPVSWNIPVKADADNKTGLVSWTSARRNKDMKSSMDTETVTAMVAMREAKRLARNNIAYVFNNTTVIPFKRYHNRFRCFYCSVEFNSCTDLRNHSMEEHPICDVKLKCMKLSGLGYQYMGIKVDSSLLACKICHEQYEDFKSLLAHLETEHGAKLGNCAEKFLPFKLMDDQYPCPQCGEVFSHFGSMLIHFNKEHNTENRVLCVTCGESFHGVTSLQTHRTRCNIAPDRFRCTRCDLGFYNKSQLTRHMGNVHKKKVFKCPHCTELFASEHAKMVHITKEHTGGFQCTHCEASFIFRSRLIQHIKRLHLLEKNEKCPYCEKMFFDQRRLKNHMVLHTGERAFSCDYCDKTFSWKKNLISHINVHLKNAGQDKKRKERKQ